MKKILFKVQWWGNQNVAVTEVLKHPDFKGDLPANMKFEDLEKSDYDVEICKDGENVKCFYGMFAKYRIKSPIGKRYMLPSCAWTVSPSPSLIICYPLQIVNNTIRPDLCHLLTVNDAIEKKVCFTSTFLLPEGWVYNIRSYSMGETVTKINYFRRKIKITK